VKNVPADALDNLLGKFFKHVRKENGGEYEPDRLSSSQRNILGRLKESKPISISLKMTSFIVPENCWSPKEKPLRNKGEETKQTLAVN